MLHYCVNISSIITTAKGEVTSTKKKSRREGKGRDVVASEGE